MKKIVFISLFLSLANLAFAEKYYLFIDQSGEQKGYELGQNAKGDVVDAYPVSEDRQPTEAEKAAYKIIIVDMTAQEVGDLLEPKMEMVFAGGNLSTPMMIVTEDRKNKVNLALLDKKANGDEIEKVDFNKAVSIKPEFLAPID